jgi:hypothetical protein
MTLEEFQQSLSGNNPPAELSQALAALWWDAKGDWDSAHSSAMLDKGQNGSWVHAYLHRKEGDRDNATGWYSRADKPFCEESFQEEWSAIVRELLAQPQ